MTNDRTVRVRIAVAVNAEGKWSAIGWDAGDDNAKSGLALEGLGPKSNAETVHFIEADVPLPASETIEGSVVP